MDGNLPFRPQESINDSFDKWVHVRLLLTLQFQSDFNHRQRGRLHWPGIHSQQKILGHFHLMFPKSWCSLNTIYFECALKTKKWRFQWFSGFVFSIKVGARKNFRVLCHGKAPSKKCISSRCRGCPMLLQLAVVLQSASWLAWLWTRRSDLSTRPTRGAWALKGVNLLFRRKHKVARSDRHARLGLFQAGRYFTSCTCQTVNSVNSRRQHRHVAHLQRAINLRPTL